MNKIVLSGGSIDLDKYMNDCEFTITENTTLNIINLHNNCNLVFKVNKGKSLVINMFDYAVDLKASLDVELDDDTNFTLNSAFIVDVKYDLSIDTKLYGSNIYAGVFVRGINLEHGTTRVSMNGVVAGETHNNEINEYVKIINKSELSNVIIPDLIVNTNDVVANHGVTISGIDKNELFYLLSKGLDEAHAVKLIEEGFLLSIMNDKVKETIKNILVGR